jgi:hypothetical protein
MIYPIRPAITPEGVLSAHRAGTLGSVLAALTVDEYEMTVMSFVAWLDTHKGYNPYHECVLRTRWQELIDEYELQEILQETTGGDNE